MGIIIRQGILNTIITYVGIGLGFILTVYLFPHILKPEEYGLTRVLLSIAFLSSQVAQLGMKNTIIRYFPYFKNQDKGHHGILFLTLTIPLAGILLVLLFFTFGKPLLIDFYIERSSLFTNYYWYVIPLFIFTVYYAVLNSYITALYDSVTGSFVKDVLLRLGIIFFLLLYYFGWLTFHEFVIYFVLFHGIQPLYLLVYLIYTGQLQLQPDFTFLNRPFIKKMANYSIYALIGGLTTVIVGNIDVIMLGSLSGLDNTAIYFVAFSVGSVIAVPKRALGKIATPILSTAFKNNNLKEIDYIYKQTSLNQILAGMLLYIGIWANLHNLFEILPKEYDSGRLVILIIGFGQLFDMAAGINGSIINLSKYYRFNLYANLFLIVLIVLTNYILIPILGIVGAAIASALSLFLYNLVKFLYVWYKLAMQPFKSNIFLILLMGIVTLGLSLSIDPFKNIYVDLILRSSLMTFIYLVPLYYFKVSRDFNNLVDNILSRLTQS